MISCRRSCASALRCGREDEAHAAAGHAAEHPEAPEVVAEFGARPRDQRLGVEVAGPGDDGLERPVEVALRARADRADVAALQVAEHFVEDAERLLPAVPLGFGAQQVFLGDHLEDRPDVLRHAAVDEDQAVLQLLARRSAERRSVPRIVWCGSSRPRLMPNSGSPSPARTPWISLMPGQTPPESCQPPPEPPSHSPRMARAATSRRSCFLERAGERLGLAGRAHADGDQGGEQVGRDGQARALGNVVDLADDLEAAARADRAARAGRRAAAPAPSSPAARGPRRSPRP